MLHGNAANPVNTAVDTLNNTVNTVNKCVQWRAGVVVELSRTLY